MTNVISILGSTGSVGRQTVEVAQRLGISVCALTADRNVELMAEQARRLRPRFVAMCDEAAARALRVELADTDIKIGSGKEGVTEAAAMEEAEAVVTAVSGAAGLYPTLAAIAAGKRIALANKETLVCAGSIVMDSAKKHGAEILPVDSEHSAIFQSLAGGRRSEVRKILLTASGGPFRALRRDQTEHVTPEQAVSHPNWSMGAKISVDSATMMNKGLELIEAVHLFGVLPDEVEILVHPESIVHSMVEFRDGAVIAQLGVPDMSLPIQYALTYPERRCGGETRLDLAAVGHLTFERPRPDDFPCLALAMDCAARGGTAPAVMNAANEVAVGRFLAGEIGYNAIYDCVAGVVESVASTAGPTLDDIIACDAEARRMAEKF